MKAAHHPAGRDRDVIEGTSEIVQWPICLTLFILRICSALQDHREKLIRGALLLLVETLPRTVGAQGADQVRAVQNIFHPLSKPAELINDTARLTLLICLIIFLVVGGLLLYSVVRFRRKSDDDDTSEP